VFDSARVPTPQLQYPVPWDLLAALTPHVAKRTRMSVDVFTADVVKRMNPAPAIFGTEHLPPTARFVLAANHYQRKGLWILHAASALTQAIRHHYGPGDPPVRWMVTANWPRIGLGPFSFRSPGDVLLPRIAHVWSCYPVSFHGTNPVYTARSIRRILHEIPVGNRPLGVFPEGVDGMAGKIADAVPGISRLLMRLSSLGVPVVPVGISEQSGLILRFGKTIQTEEVQNASDAATLVLERIRRLAS